MKSEAMKAKVSCCGGRLARKLFRMRRQGDALFHISMVENHHGSETVFKFFQSWTWPAIEFVRRPSRVSGITLILHLYVYMMCKQWHGKPIPLGIPKHGTTGRTIYGEGKKWYARRRTFHGVRVVRQGFSIRPDTVNDILNISLFSAIAKRNMPGSRTPPRIPENLRNAGHIQSRFATINIRTMFVSPSPGWSSQSLKKLGCHCNATKSLISSASKMGLPLVLLGPQVCSSPHLSIVPPRSHGEPARSIYISPDVPERGRHLVSSNVWEPISPKILDVTLNDHEIHSRSSCIHCHFHHNQNSGTRHNPSTRGRLDIRTKEIHHPILRQFLYTVIIGCLRWRLL